MRTKAESSSKQDYAKDLAMAQHQRFVWLHTYAHPEWFSSGVTWGIPVSLKHNFCKLQSISISLALRNLSSSFQITQHANVPLFLKRYGAAECL